MKNIPLFEAIAVLVGTIIGAGVMGLPFVFQKNGFWTGAIALALVGGAAMLSKLILGEAILRTNGIHQISGYAEIYLGKFFKFLVSFSMIFGIYGALLAYTVGEGEIISAVTGLPNLWGSLCFYIIFCLMFYFGINLIKKTELFLSLFLVVVIFVIAIYSFSAGSLSRLSGLHLNLLFEPYGVLIFACSGFVALPHMRQILRGKASLFRKAIVWGCLIPIAIYLLFSGLVVAISPFPVNAVATITLGQVLGPLMSILANIFGFFAMATSFLTLSLALQDLYQRDYHLPHFLSWFLVAVIPIALYLLGLRNFLGIIGFVGALGVGINGLANSFIYFAARKKGPRKPEFCFSRGWGTFVGFFTAIIFLGGIIYTLLRI